MRGCTNRTDDGRKKERNVMRVAHRRSGVRPTWNMSFMSAMKASGDAIDPASMAALTLLHARTVHVTAQPGQISATSIRADTRIEFQAAAQQAHAASAAACASQAGGLKKPHAALSRRDRFASKAERVPEVHGTRDDCMVVMKAQGNCVYRVCKHPRLLLTRSSECTRISGPGRFESVRAHSRGSGASRSAKARIPHNRHQKPRFG